MSVGYGRAWDIAGSVPLEGHDGYCAYRRTAGGLLCDCHVLIGHPEYTGSVVPAGG